ncbi:MAG: hypothetical protein HOW73_12425 [Polyangiaceae bacterium]|nr:hypothetical protein [Polyangiaceae bacterium]
MKWSVLSSSIPEQPGPAREAALLSAIRAGYVVHRWVPLVISEGGRTLEVEVSEDALMVGEEGDRVRVTTDATTAQLVADHFDALLLTPRVSDWIRASARVLLEPIPQTPDSAMGNTSRMVQHSRSIDAARASLSQVGLASTVGKDWVLTNRLAGHAGRAANYGWHTKKPSFPATMTGMSVLQPLGLAHDRFHSDYSQTWRGMRRACRLNGAPYLLTDVLRDPVLSSLVSHEGPLSVLRLPGVPVGSTPSVPPPPPDPVGSVPRTLRRGMAGTDVAAWQRVIGVDDDGIFGSATESATKAWQSAHGLTADGVVGARTRASAEQTHLFVQAKHFGTTRGAAIDTIVLHSMEAVEKPETAERVAAWFAGPSAPKASAHYCVDSNSIVQCVRDSHVAFHAPGVNQRSIGIEHAGYARQSAEDWGDAYSMTMLRRSARLVAELCRRYSIPIVLRDAAELQRGLGGITTHSAVSRAFRRSTHTDPGSGFPLEAYLAMVGEY